MTISTLSLVSLQRGGGPLASLLIWRHPAGCSALNNSHSLNSGFKLCTGIGTQVLSPKTARDANTEETGTKANHPPKTSQSTSTCRWFCAVQGTGEGEDPLR